ncbi:hypothetical protein [Alicyclobacillus sp. SO9]|uniref:hypothetical protein n=1 Tax=Alicyclobacillus sp. SO9 TaxID=2665646 RepID=UPI0018E73A17|nr:hypothetical protein [Alicyclobacillus sp. SO9]QQE77171.1 hypothetical protein GI364_14470 [Alicyclobacillus sp. SO9]
MAGQKSNQKKKLTILVTAGLVTGYVITIRREFQKGDKTSAFGNAVLLPASLIWLWLIQ